MAHPGGRKDYLLFTDDEIVRINHGIMDFTVRAGKERGRVHKGEIYHALSPSFSCDIEVLEVQRLGRWEHDLECHPYHKDLRPVADIIFFKPVTRPD